jgi:hypothetical protein
MTNHPGAKAVAAVVVAEVAILAALGTASADALRITAIAAAVTQRGAWKGTIFFLLFMPMEV